MLKRASKYVIKELKKYSYIKTDSDKTFSHEDVNINDFSTVAYNSDTENMQTTPAISSSQQQAKRRIKKYTNLKTKKKYTGYKNAKLSKYDDFLKQVPLHPSQR